jgi:hypothetical protein
VARERFLSSYKKVKIMRQRERPLSSDTRKENWNTGTVRMASHPCHPRILQPGL